MWVGDLGCRRGRRGSGRRRSAGEDDDGWAVLGDGGEGGGAGDAKEKRCGHYNFTLFAIFQS